MGEATQIATINDVIRSLAQAPDLVRERTRVWFERSPQTGNSWYMELAFLPKPFAFVAKRRLEKHFESVTRYAFFRGYHCYFRYSRKVDLDTMDDHLLVRVHIVTFGQPQEADLKVLGNERKTLTVEFPLEAVDLAAEQKELVPA